MRIKKENETTKSFLPKLAFWTILWVATMALSAFGPKFLWSNNTTLTITAVSLNFIIGCKMILANIRYWKSLDEMMQRIQLDAMGLALGIGIVGGLSYSMLVANDVLSLRSEISVMVVIMSLTYITATIIGVMRTG
jgi:hypothetical protein